MRARLAERAEDWPWSSARAHLAGRDDGLVEVAPLLARCGGRCADLLAVEPSLGATTALRAAETIGRPLGAPAFLDRLAALTGRDPAFLPKRGPKPRAAEGNAAKNGARSCKCHRNPFAQSARLRPRASTGQRGRPVGRTLQNARTPAHAG